MHVPGLRPALLSAACLLLAAPAAAAVNPPPLPPGSNLVRVDPGMNHDERKRHVRAHHHKFHHKKDLARDDSVHGHESEVAVRTAVPIAPAVVPGAAPAGVPRAAGAVPQGGAGTGPARGKTERGASSYFYGDDKK